MKTLRSIRSSAPLIAQLGFAVLLTGFAADLVFHLSGAADADGSSAPLIAHLVTVAGMVLVLTGVIQVAVTTVHRARTKGGNDAARRSTTATR
jgi:hypothetical protein